MSRVALWDDPHSSSDEYPYLEYSITNDTAHCFVCSLFPSAIEGEKSDDAWITGTRSWHKIKGSQGKGKAGKLSQHFNSKSHAQSLVGEFCPYLPNRPAY